MVLQSLSTTAAAPPIRASVIFHSLLPWLAMAALAVVNGGFRETALVPRLGASRAHVVSTVVLVAGILLVSFLYFSLSAIDYAWMELALVGATWVVLTVGFEFVVGYVEGTPVSTTLGQYDVLAGQVWILVPLTLLVSPLLFGWYLAG